MMSAGFQWGAVLNKQPTTHAHPSNISDLETTTPNTTTALSHVPRYSSSSLQSAAISNSTTLKKRKREDTEGNSNTFNININNNNNNDNNNSNAITSTSRKFIHPTHSTSSHKYKKSKTPRINGQPLPLPRLIEALDKSNLQKLLQDLIIIHPELQSTITKIAPKPSIQDSLDLLQEKFQMIISHLPYKCDVESDYSYLRIKPHLQEFLSCVSDFILNYLPPLEINMVHSLQFLEEITKMVHNLPNFTNQEFQYTKSTALEQIANCWLIVLSQTDNEKEDVTAEMVVEIIHELELFEKLHNHNEASLNKFQKVIDYCNDKLHQHELIMNNNNVASAASAANPNNGAVPASLSDLISVDYSKYSITNTSSM